MNKKGLIEEPFRKSLGKSSIAQGSIEYLVIVAIVVVIGLLVVGLSGNFFDSTSGISSGGGKMISVLGPIGIVEGVIDSNGDGLFSLINNGYETITITEITVGEEENEFSKSIVFGNTTNFYLSNLGNNCYCGDSLGEWISCELNIKYLTVNGIEKTHKVTVFVNCVGDTVPATSFVENEPPVISLTSPLAYVKKNNIVTFNYDVNDDSDISACELIIDGSPVQTDSDGTYGTFTRTFSSDGTYSWDVNCTDVHSNEGASSNGSFDFNYDAPPVYFATKAGGSSYDYGGGIVTGADGNLFVTGVMWDPGYFGDIYLDFAENYAMFIAKMDQDTNEWLFAEKVVGASSDVYSGGIALMQDNNLVVVGEYSADAVVTKVSPVDGSVLWTAAASGGASRVDGVVVDSDGNIYAVGSFSGDVVSFGDINLGTTRDPIFGTYVQAGFVAKLDASGNWLWVAMAQSSGTNFADFVGVIGVDVDSDNNVIVSGYFGNPSTSNETNFGLISRSTLLPWWDCFVGKISRDSNTWIWVTQAFTTDGCGEVSTNVVVDSDNNIYVTGDFGGTGTFGSDQLTELGSGDGFISKIDGDTNAWWWTTQIGDPSYGEPIGIALDSSEDVFITGAKGSPVAAFVSKFDKDTNAMLWEQISSSTSNAEGFDLFLDVNNDVVLTGYFYGTADFNYQRLVSSGSADILVWKIDVPD